MEVHYSERNYKFNEVCFFKETKAYGGLSNMASGFTLVINDYEIPSSEALYQACRFPHLPEIQKAIIREKSPMSAKMISKKNYKQTRSDWEQIKVEVMRWCLKVKLAQNFYKFGSLLELTGTKPIVELSRKDKFWGTVKSEKDDGMLVGVNAMGRLLMELREDYLSENKFRLLYVSKPNIKDFYFLGKEINPTDSFTDYFIFSIRSLFNFGSHVVKNPQIEFNEEKIILSFNETLPKLIELITMFKKELDATDLQIPKGLITQKKKRKTKTEKKKSASRNLYISFDSGL